MGQHNDPEMALAFMAGYIESLYRCGDCPERLVDSFNDQCRKAGVPRYVIEL